jgi:hypothetical protein
MPSFQAISSNSSFKFIALSANIDEGSEGTINVNASGMTNGTYYWTIEHITTSSSDFVANSGSFNVAAKQGSFTIEIANDENGIDATDIETYKLAIRKGSISGPIVAISNEVSVLNLPQIVEFDLINAPQAGSTWTDATSGVTATIAKTAVANNDWTTTATYGGGVTFDENSKGYIEIPGVNTADNSFTISIAGDFSSHPNHYAPFYDGSVLNRSTNNIWANIWGELGVGTEVRTIAASTPSQSGKINSSGVSWWDFVYNGTAVKAYRDGNLIIDGTLSSANLGWRSKLRFANEYNIPGNSMLGTWYRIKYKKTALDQTAITSQFNAVRSTYGGLTGSIQFNGTNQYLEYPGAMGVQVLWSNNFTMEMWVYPTKSTGQQTFISNVQGAEGIYFGTGNDLYPIVNVDGSSIGQLESYIPLTLNAWNHVALTRQNGGDWNLYVNGNLGDAGPIIGRSGGHQTFRIGGQGARYFQGYISNVRYLNNNSNTAACLYTGMTYTVPTAPLIRLVDTQILLNTINGGRFLYDASTNGYIFSNRNTATSSNQNPF